MNTLNRRGFLGALLAAPAIVKAENIMRIWVPPAPKVVPRVFPDGLVVWGENTSEGWLPVAAGEFPDSLAWWGKGTAEDWMSLGADRPMTATEALEAQRMRFEKIEAAMLQLSRVGYSTLDLSRLELHQ